LGALTAKKLTLFFAEVREGEKLKGGVEVLHLKDKLGTRQMPTAELLLTGLRAHRVDPPSSWSR
jgi:acyl-CoA dehydrogenase